MNPDGHSRTWHLLNANKKMSGVKFDDNELGMAMKKVGIKFDDNKLRYDLLPTWAMEEVVKIFTDGAKKYEDRNWEKGLKWGRVYAAAQRHMNQFWGGEDIDKESGSPHLAHAITNLLFLLHYSKFRPEFNDRPKPF